MGISVPLGQRGCQLSDFDHFVKEQLKVQKYLRYVDDFALFSDDHQLLKNCRIAIEEYLVKLRLKIHPIKSQLFQTKHGATFLGFRVFPEKIRVTNSNLHRGRKRLKKLQKDYLQGKVSLEDFKQSLNSWEAHLEHGDTWQLRQKIFSSLVFTRN